MVKHSIPFPQTKARAEHATRTAAPATPTGSATLQDVAARAGVSMMTVSRVLRNAPKVAAETRERVMSAARALSYQPDPHLARMMSLVRGKKRQRIRAVIAVIREHVPKDDLLSASYQYVPIEDVLQRAQGYGYAVEEFWLGRDGMTPERLQKILHARGIEGVIVSPQSRQLPCSQLNYSGFAAAAFGHVMREPALHLSAGNMMMGIQRATAELMARGYQRIGLAVTKWVDDRAQNGYCAAMLSFQETVPVTQRVPTLLLPHNNISRSFGPFSEWMRKHEPDALITFDTHVPGWLKRMNLRVPEDIGFVVHDWTPSMTGYAGIHQRRDHVAAAAVDLVATQLAQNERGLPTVPRQIMIPPQWIDGPSIRPLR